MKIIIEGAPKEIAALVLELQERQDKAKYPLPKTEKLIVEGEIKDGFYIG